MTLFFRRASMGLLLLWAGSVLWGCNTDIRNYCKDMAECEGLSSADEDACIVDLKGERKVADEYGCRDEFDDFYTCIVDNGQCEFESGEGVSYYTTGTDEVGYPNCIAEEGIYDTCGLGESNL